MILRKESLNSDEKIAAAQLIAVRELFYAIFEYISVNYPDILQEPDFFGLATRTSRPPLRRGSDSAVTV